MRNNYLKAQIAQSIYECRVRYMLAESFGDERGAMIYQQAEQSWMRRMKEIVAREKMREYA